VAITRVAGQAGGALAGSAASVSKAFAGDVTAGNLLVILVARWSQTVNDPPVVGDISKSAGTATLGAFTLDRVQTQSFAGPQYIHSAIFSAVVATAGTGSCTVQVTGNASDAWMLAVAEYTAPAVFNDARLVGVNSVGGASGAPDSGTVTSTGEAVFCGIVSTVTSGATTHTCDAAFTDIYESENGAANQTGNACDRIVGSGVTDSASWTAPTTVPWAAALAVYKSSGRKWFFGRTV
jgi:hypothetical protein